MNARFIYYNISKQFVNQKINKINYHGNCQPIVNRIVIETTTISAEEINTQKRTKSCEMNSNQFYQHTCTNETKQRTIKQSHQNAYRYYYICIYT